MTISRPGISHMAAVCVLAFAALPAIAAAPKVASAPNWNARVAVTPDGSHSMGNPKAPVQIREFVSYTCSHCAHFVSEGDPALKQKLIPDGKVFVTVTNLLRNPVDATVATLTTCGDATRFFARHNAFFASQATWMGKLRTITPAQEGRWNQGSNTERMKAIAADFDFYSIVSAWGMSRAQADKCLADPVIQDKLRKQQQVVKDVGATSTPSFVLNGRLLDVHDWAGLSQAITDELAARSNGGA